MLNESFIANLNYLLVILAINLIGFSYFFFSPARKAVDLRPTVFCFMVFFALAALAFVIFASRIFIPPVISLTLANALFILSAYYVKNGFMFRSGKAPGPMRRNFVVWANIVLITLLNTGVFYFVYDNFALRASITHLNCALIFFTCVGKIPKNHQEPTAGERIATVAIWGAGFFTGATAVLHWFEQSFFSYMSALMFTQAIVVTGLMGAFLTLIMSDLIEDHYKNSVTDPLTGVYNRRFFIDKAPKLIGFTQSQRVKHSLIVADIDNFKQVNDEHGHAVGDEALVKFAALLSNHVRDTDLVARFGGEEFVVLLPGASVEVAEALAKRLCTAASENTIETSAGSLNLTASFGVANLPGPEGLSSSLKTADDAMYQAKQKGKNQVVAHRVA